MHPQLTHADRQPIMARWSLVILAFALVGACGREDVNTKLTSTESHIGDAHSVAYQGKLQCPTLEGGGEVEIRAKLDTAGSVALRKCDLVLKQ